MSKDRVEQRAEDIVEILDFDFEKKLLQYFLGVCRDGSFAKVYMDLDNTYSFSLDQYDIREPDIK